MSGALKYWIPDHLMTEDDAYELDESGFDLEYAAKLAADDYHSNHDGWDAAWPIVFVVKQGDATGTFSVDREAVPEFHAREVKP